MIGNGYTPQKWYWIVGDDVMRAWSSAAAAYVGIDDATFTAWLAEGNVPTSIDTEASLWEVLRNANVPPFHAIGTCVLVARLESAGKADAADDYMTAHNPLRRRFYTVGKFAADDAEFTAMLVAIDADQAVILARE